MAACKSLVGAAPNVKKEPVLIVPPDFKMALLLSELIELVLLLTVAVKVPLVPTMPST